MLGKAITDGGISKMSDKRKNLNIHNSKTQADGALKKESTEKNEPVGFRRAVPIICYALAAFISLCFITQNTGLLGNFIAKFLTGLFGGGAFVIPVLLVIHGVFYFRDVKNRCAISRVIFSVIAVLAISSLLYTVYTFGNGMFFTPKQFWRDGIQLVGGGFIGGVLSYGLMKIVGNVGMIVIAVAIFSLYISFFFAKAKLTPAKLFYSILSAITGLFAKIEKALKRLAGKQKVKKEKKPQSYKSKKSGLFDDEFFATDNKMQELSIPELGIKETRSARVIEENPTLQEKVYPKSMADGGEVRKDEPIVADFSEPKSRTSSEPKNHTYNPDFSYKTAAKASAKEADDAYIVYDMPDVSEKSAREKNRIYGLDENAEDVFTKDFDPFDFVANERLANKPSSRSDSISRGTAGIGSFEQSISDVTEEDAERARRIAEFEMRKKASLQRMRREATPVGQPSESFGEAKAVEINVETPEVVPAARDDSTYRATIDKSEYIPNEEEEIFEDDFDTDDSSDSGFTVTDTNPTSVSEESDVEAAGGDVFKPFESPAIDEFSIETDRSEEKEPEILRTERSMLNPSLIFEDEDDGELTFFNDIDEGELSEDDGDVIIPEEERNPEVDRMRRMFPVLDRVEDEKSDYSAPTESVEPDVADAADDEPPFEVEPKISVSSPLRTQPTFASSEPAGATFASSEPVEQADNTPKKPDFSNYEFPSIDLLAKDERSTESSDEEIQENANKLIETLASFNVTVSIKGFDRGPRITRYEVVPGPGVKVTQVTSREDDIALNLAADIRMEAPIPGKSAIGIEIPNKRSETVRLRDLIETEDFQLEKSKTFVCLGKDVAGYPVFTDIEKLPHVLIAGATGMGKSVCINSILISMLYKARPDEVRLIMIDPKKVEFNMYNGIPHLLVPVVTEAKQAAGALMWAVEQMEHRYDLIGKMCVRNISAYNDKVKADPSLGEPMPRIVIVIDELNDLMIQVKNPVENLIMSIAQKARAAGIHLIIGTQRPSVDVITGVIKANISSRIACKVASNVDSRTILEQAGAEKLLGKGDMLFYTPGKSKPVRVQGAFVSDNEVEDIMAFLKQGSDGQVYDSQVLEEINRAAKKCEKNSSDDRDEGRSEGGDGYLNDRQFLDAVEVAVNTGKISTSLLQRKISIGFGKAAKFIDIMEDMGIVGGPNGQKPRDVLMSADEWHEKLARTELD